MRKLYTWLILLPFCVTGFIQGANAQTSLQVKGKVTSSDGPLPGVSIQIKGSSTGTTTDANGAYSVVVNDNNAVLVFSFIGFLSEEVPVNGQSTIDVTLTEDVETLSEVVVVGYGTESRKNLTSAISTIKTEELNRGAISDVGQLLQGKVPGLNISRSGDPNRAAAIILRGASTLRDGAQSPLFVIDGVIGADISLIAPDDITAIDVLKDASATAIYGNRGANGVIIVTTRRPTKGEGTVSYSGYISLDKVSHQYEMMDANQLRTFVQDNGLVFNPADDLGANTNWQNEVQRSSAVSHNHNLSLTGGGEKTTYIASLNYFNQEGIIRESGLKRVVAKLGVEQKTLRDKLKLGLSVTNSFSDARLVPYRNTVLSQMVSYLPTVPVRNADGTYFAFTTNNHNTDYNPVAMQESATERSKYNTFLGSLTAQLDLPFNLKYNLQASYQSLTTNYGAYYNSYFTNTFESVRNTPDPPNNPAFINITGKDGLAVRNTYQYTNVIFETYFTWDKSFGNHSVNAVLGYSWQENTNGDGFQTSSTNFSTDDVSYNNLSLSNPYGVSDFRVDFGSSIYDQIRLISDFLRVKYDYDSRYLLQLSLRRDGSSAFGVNHRWGYFPSVGAAWRISKESFMDNTSFISDLKLRASYGVTGNSAGFNAYTTKLLYGFVGTTVYQGNTINAISAIQNDNPDLRWEKTSTANIGLDFSILSDRISGSFEVYDKRTTDVIYPYPVNTNQYLYSQLVANVGEVSNRGYEIALNANVVDRGSFSWNTSLNLAHNKNEIVTLSNDIFKADTIRLFAPEGSPGQTGATVQALMSGQPIGTFYTYQYAGKNENGVSQYLKSDGTLTTTASQLTLDDYQVVGNAQPKLLLGWSNNLKYKNFDLNIFFRGVFGSKIMNITRADLFKPSMATINNLPVEAASESVNDVNSFRYSSRFVESGNYVRLDNATLGYNFKKLGQDIKRLRLYVSVNNLFVITNYKGIDPEINQGGIAPGVDSKNFYPKTRTFLIGVNASF
ncbi:SusC/RagA family TonB-linked outer membrane protein [Ohtaekwangia kribbensis]|uniref:SusC/RagA family TonB-linked outer membrane protein n=1 Tax=Ohtaekwangia kribbensis TaxID=688913 RepID=A0ABW3K4D8_9BACT